MPYSRPYAGGFVDYPSTTTPINSTALNTMDVGIKTANDQFQTVTTAQRTALTPTVGQCVWDSDLRQLMVYMNASGGNAWQPIGNRIVCTSTTRPATPFHGQVIYETDSKKEFVYNGTAWVQTNTASTTSGVTGVSNLIVPPMCQVRRTTNLTSYTNQSAISWESSAFDTDGMWSSGTTVTINTTGIYLVTFSGFASGAATITTLNPVVLRGSDLALTTGIALNSGVNAYFTLSGMVNFTATQTVTARVDFTGGSAYVVGGSATEGIGQTRLALTWIGRTS